MKLNYTFVLSGLLLLFACGGDDGPTAPASTTTLTQAQANALAEELNEGVTAGNPFVTKLATRVQSTQTTEQTCPGGGKIVVTYSAAAASTSGGTFDNTSTYQDCVVEVEGSGAITVNGELSNNGTLGVSGFDSVSDNSFSFSYDADVVGLLSVTGPNVEAGDCGIGIATSIDVTFAGESTPPTATFSSTGTICGTAFSDSGTDSLDG